MFARENILAKAQVIQYYNDNLLIGNVFLYLFYTCLIVFLYFMVEDDLVTHERLYESTSKKNDIQYIFLIFLDLATQNFLMYFLYKIMLYG